MAYQFGNQQSVAIDPSIHAWAAAGGQKVWRAYLSAGTVVIDRLDSQGYTVTASAVVVDNTTTGISDIGLNEPLVVDPITGKLHILYEKNTSSGGNPPQVLHKSSSDDGATWSALHTLDNGSGHANNGFCRVGLVAYNDYLSCCYIVADSSVFTTDGLWEVHSGDGGATWSVPSKLYTSPVYVGEPNMALGEDGSAHLSWFDSGVNVNAGGDVYYASGTFNGSGWTWPASPARLTTGEVWGRIRVFTSNGVVMLVGNTTWGGTVADVGLLRSTDNGVTWGTTTTLATHTVDGPLSHPWGSIGSDRASIIWLLSPTLGGAATYFQIFSTDAGVSWGSSITPLTTTSNIDAPRIVLTKDNAIAIGANGSNVIYNWFPLFAPDPAVTASIDTCNRADENPLSDSGKWTQSLDASGSARIVSTAATRQTGSGSFDRAGSYRNTFTIDSSFEAYADCVVGASGGDGSFSFDLWTSAKTGYRFQVNQASGIIFSVTTGSFTSEVDDGVTVLTSSDRYCARLDAACVVLVRFNNATGFWMEIARWADATSRSALLYSFDISGFNAVPSVRNFGGGILYVPSNTDRPIVTGAVANGSTLSATEGTWATDSGKTPTRFSYQWQNSTNGGATWSDITRATLAFYTIGTVNGIYSVNVTAQNSIGSTTVRSALDQLDWLRPNRFELSRYHRPTIVTVP